MYIKIRKRIIKCVEVITIILIALLLILINNSFSATEITYKERYISKGDTLWNIAKYEKDNNLYFKDKDIRDIVSEIKYVNNLHNCNLMVGKKLIIPLYN